MKYNLDFIKPFEAHNRGGLRAMPVAGGGTQAVMGMKMISPRPWNAIGWMMTGAVGDDFEKSLKKLKDGIERGTIATSTCKSAMEHRLNGWSGWERIRQKILSSPDGQCRRCSLTTAISLQPPE